MKIVIVGAGNIGFGIASYLKTQMGIDAVICTQSKHCEVINYIDVERKIYENGVKLSISSSFDEEISTSDLVICTYPAHLRKEFLDKYSESFHNNSILGFFPAYGGIEYSCKKLLNKGIKIFGLQRVPFIARKYEEKDISLVKILSWKRYLEVGTIPNSDSEIRTILEHLFKLEVRKIPYLAASLVPANPELHLSGLIIPFKKLYIDQEYIGETKMYDNWSDENSKFLFKLDSEIRKVINLFSSDIASCITPIPFYYDSSTPNELTKKLKSINAFKEVNLPLVSRDDKVYPDFNARMFVEDIPFGICIYKDIALTANIKTPYIDMILEFYESMTGIQYFDLPDKLGKDYFKCGAPGASGIKTVTDLEELIK